MKCSQCRGQIRIASPTHPAGQPSPAGPPYQLADIVLGAGVLLFAVVVPIVIVLRAVAGV
jgi:hypothetical protein